MGFNPKIGDIVVGNSRSSAPCIFEVSSVNKEAGTLRALAGSIYMVENIYAPVILSRAALLEVWGPLMQFLIKDVKPITKFTAYEKAYNLQKLV